MESKTTPLEMRMTGKGGKTEFHLYINGEEDTIKQAIDYLQNYLKLIKTKEKRNGKRNQT